MWQSRVEIEGYSIAYFDSIAAFKAPYRSTMVILTHLFDIFNFHINVCSHWLGYLVFHYIHIMRLIIKQAMFILVYEQLLQGTAGKRKKEYQKIKTADLTYLPLKLLH